MEKSSMNARKLRGNLLRKGAIIVIVHGKYKGRIGKLISKEGYGDNPKGYYGIELSDEPFFLLPCDYVRYAYSYEKLLRRRKISYSTYESPTIPSLRKGSIIIANDKDMGVHSVIPNMNIVSNVDGTTVSIINLVSLQTEIISLSDFVLIYRNLNGYETRKLNKYGKTIIANRERR